MDEIRRIFVIASLFFSSAVFAEATGFIVSLKDMNQAEAFDAHAEKLGLKKENSSPSIRLVFYNSKSTSKKDLCPELRKHPSVEFCEVNKESLPDEEEDCELPDSIVDPNLENLLSIVSPVACEIVRTQPRYHGLLPGLSPLWAQEATGADLVRSELVTLGLGDLGNLVGILDTNQENNHGKKVANLISSPHLTSIIPGEPAEVQEMPDSDSYVFVHQRWVSSESGPPHYINNSMAWRSQAIQRVFADLASRGSVSIVSAGNAGRASAVEEKKSSLGDQIILIGNINPSGRVDPTSEYSSETVISAPSEYSVMSHDDHSFSRFGGTSGAAPQVTGALTAFTLLSGYELSVEEAQNLLRRTAVLLPHSHNDPPTHGAGSLNSYKISQVAKRLAEICRTQTAPQRNSCIQENLRNDSTYNFPRANLQEAESAFASCFSQAPPAQPYLNCESRLQLFRRIRQEALLHPGDHRLWSAVACIYEQEGFKENAIFYRLVANSSTPEQLRSSIEERMRFGAVILEEEKSEIIAAVRIDPGFLVRMIQNDHLMEASSALDGLSAESLSPDLMRNIFNQMPVTGASYFVASKLAEKMRGRSPDAGLWKSVLHHGAYMDAIELLKSPEWSPYPELARELIRQSIASNNLEKREMVEFLNLPHWQRNESLNDLRNEVNALP